MDERPALFVYQIYACDRSEYSRKLAQSLWILTLFAVVLWLRSKISEQLFRLSCKSLLTNSNKHLKFFFSFCLRWSKVVVIPASC